MNKKIKNLFLAGALVLGFAGVAVSCTDYDDDINKLKEENSQLASTIKDLQSKINAGCVITGVTATDDGLVITTSDGKTYTITNGKDGAPGAPGAPGKDGGFYKPNADGFWYYYASKDAEGEKTDLTVFPVGTITAELKDGKLILHNVKNEKGEYEDLKFDLEKALSSLVFVPQCYVDGVEGMDFVSMRYNALSGKNADSKTEKWSAGDKTTHINPEFEAEYHVNSADVKLDATYTYSFVKKDVPYIHTRTNASEDFDVVPTFKSFKDGILTVSVAVTGTEANENWISVVALRAQKKDVVVVSDYATLIRREFGAPVIAWPQAISEKAKNIKVKDAHFRRYIATVDAGAFLKDQIVWSEGHTNLEQAHATCDTAVVYNESLDLKSIVAAHVLNGDVCREFNSGELKEFGLDWKFELVKNYKIGTPVTDQADFATIENGMFTPKVFSTDGTAAIGRTPIVRVSLMNGKNVVAVAYIKIFIKSPAPVEKEIPTYELKPVDEKKDNIFKFISCTSGVNVLFTTVEDMNVEIYNKENLSKKNFHLLYNEFVPNAGATDAENIGTVEDVINGDAEATHVLKWTLDYADLFKYSGKTITHIVQYRNADDAKTAVNVKLTATVQDLSQYMTFDVTEAEYIKEYWDDARTQTIYNVAIPADGSVDPTKCVYSVDINASFETIKVPGADYGQIRLFIGSTNQITNVKYFFCKDHMEKITKVGDVAVKFTVNADGTELKAKVGDKNEVVANINNTATKAPWNVFTYNKESAVAKQLLNTGKMIVKIGAVGTICGNSDYNREIKLTFKGQDHFDALVKVPVTIATTSADSFTDGVDFGQPGSYVDIAKVIDPSDWRKLKFSDNPNYWDYYGPFTIRFDIYNAQAYLNGRWDSLPATIDINQSVAGSNVISTKDGKKTATLENAAKYGYLTYCNNGVVVDKAFQIRVKAEVEYGWGVIMTDWITIDVNKTIGQ